MKVPVIPLVIATTIVVIVVVLFNSMGSRERILGAPRLEKLVDLDGVETEITIAPDGARLVAVASGDLWLFDITRGSRQRLTETPDPESFPAFAPDGKRLTFTRHNDTFILSAESPADLRLFKENATSLSWSTTGQQAFVRGRTLWVTDVDGVHERALIEPDSNPEISVRSPRFSPDGAQVAFVKTTLELHGEVWIVDASGGAAQALVADRWAENPLDVGWIENGRKLVYLTNRSGANALWFVDLHSNVIAPLTTTLNFRPLDRIGMAVWLDRIFVPRHDIDSDIVGSDGTIVARTPDIEFAPASSKDGKLVAYTIQKDTRSEIWTTGIHGEFPTFRGLGTQPRFSVNGFELVYTNTDDLGQVDVRKLDMRDGSSSSVTDAAEIDFQPDWSPDGRTIAFASDKGGSMSLWAIPAGGGKRRSLNANGYFPRFLPDGRSVLYWRQEALWKVDSNGQNMHRIRDSVGAPAAAAWLKASPKTYRDPEIHDGKMIWPEFDVLPDGRILTAPIHTRETAVWAVNLTYVDK
jgi:Tol biopolymer transport system component